MSEPQKFKFVPKRTVEWIPKTDLGKLVKSKKITLDEIFQHSLKIEEPEIVDFFFGDRLKEEVISTKSIQKQTKAGQRTRIKVVMVIGDMGGYVGIGTKSGRDFATAKMGALIRAKRAIRPVKMGYWGNTVGDEHTVPMRIQGKAGSVKISLFPAPKGTGLVAGQIPKTILQLAGIKDIFTKSSGNTATTENFAKATFNALENATLFYMPNLWNVSEKTINPLIKYHDFLRKETFTDFD